VIAEDRAAQEAVLAAFDREDREEDEDEVIWAAQDRQMDAQFELFTTAPTTAKSAGFSGLDRTEQNGAGWRLRNFKTSALNHSAIFP
jgi:hypothetical protein